MIQMGTILDVADNTGAKKIACIHLRGGSAGQYGRLGDTITASVKEASGPEVLTAAATYTVQSWFFRLVSAERLHLVPVFDFSGETAKAAIRPE